MAHLRDYAVLNNNAYASIYRQLNSLEDAQRLSPKLRLSRELLSTILRQKITRNTRRNYRRLWVRRNKLRRAWLSGEGFASLARRHAFSPVMTAFIVLRAMGWPRKKVAAALRVPSKAKNARVARELEEAVRHDLVYSPSSTAEQTRRGKEVEERVSRWLASLGVPFLREPKLKGKTPDFLLGRPLAVHGREIHWIECKASFGDLAETRRDAREQLEDYARLFGPGMVVYWHGFTKRHARIPGVVVESQRVLENQRGQRVGRVFSNLS